MKLSEIIKKLKEQNLLLSNFDDNILFENITYNSKEVTNNTLFVCKGVAFKKEYLIDAIEKGATCYVSEIDYKVSIPCLLVNDVRKSLAILSLAFYPDNIFKIGITGTKGKTTTNYFIHNILKHHLGYKPGILATHYFYVGKRSGENHLTTPESLELHKYLNEMMESNIKYMSMEVSSQASKHGRIYGMNFDIGCFLNISPDHISPLEHLDFEDYFNSKLDFLKKCKTVVIYRHTDYYEKVLEMCKDKKVITFGFKDADYIISNINNNDGISFDFGKDEVKTYSISMQGRFNVINAACAVVIANLLNVSYDQIQKGLIETSVSGRMNVVNGGICPIIIDYAHNELSARALYESLKEDYKDRNIKAVFGCPGDKGINRRRDMGLLAGIYASHIYLTAEDPGNSSVNDICQDIIKYVKKHNNNYEVIEDRKEAIEKAINEATSKDVIVILGKGDENYQIIGNKWIPYETDIEIVKKVLQKVRE